MTAIKLVAVSGGLGHPSRAAALAQAITAEIAASTAIEAHAISVRRSRLGSRRSRFGKGRLPRR